MTKIAVLGPEKTYTDLAADLLPNKAQKVYFPSIIKTLKAVKEMPALIPFENTLDGFVLEGLDVIIKEQLWIDYQVKLRVSFNLASYGNNLKDIKKVYVQFKTYGQCLELFNQYGFEAIITQSNMESLEKLKASRKKEEGAIIPSHIDFKEFGLVLKDVADAKDNETRFVHVTNKKDYTKHQDEALIASIIITPLEDRAGLLYDLLRKFAEKEINLRTIFSRPRKDKIGKYVFYLEFNLAKDKLYLLDEINITIKKELDCEVAVLGLYNRFKEELCEQ